MSNFEPKFKFDLSEKVWIKSCDKEGIVVRKHRSYTRINGPCSDIEDVYEVRYEIPNFVEDSHTIEYLGNKPQFTMVKEKDLEKMCSRSLVDMLDDVMKKLEAEENSSKTNGNVVFAGPSINPMDKAHYHPLRPDMIACEHSWKKYEGFTNSYDYCEKCDEKRK